MPEVPQGPDGLADPVLVLGRRVYVGRCVNCHGSDGGSIAGVQLSGDAIVQIYPDIDDHISVITNGSDAMPAFADILEPEEIEAVARFTREIL